MSIIVRTPARAPPTRATSLVRLDSHGSLFSFSFEREDFVWERERLFCQSYGILMHLGGARECGFDDDYDEWLIFIF